LLFAQRALQLMLLIALQLSEVSFVLDLPFYFKIESRSYGTGTVN
jgi:hypothetical protein